MRINRGTIVLVVALIVVIAAVLLLNNNQAEAPGGEVTGTAVSEAVALMAGVNESTLTRLEVRDNTTGERTILLKQEVDSPWVVEKNVVGREEPLTGVEVEPVGGAEGEVLTTGAGESSSADAAEVASLIGLLSTLESADSFESDQLGDFGLAEPQYTVLATTSESAVYTMHIGAQSPTNPRRYVIVEQISGATDVTPGVPVSEGPESTEVSATEGAEATETTGSNIVDPGETSGRPGDLSDSVVLEEMTAEATDQVGVVANVTQAIVVGEMIDATNAAVGTAVAQAGSTAEATAPGGEQAGEGEAIATQIVEPGEDSGAPGDQSIGVELSEIDATAEATDEMADAEMTLETVEEATPEPTPAPLDEPLVRLEGSYTVYVVQQTVVDRLIALLTDPPIAEPTPEGATEPLSTDGTDEPAVEPPQTSLREETPEATAEATAEGE